MKDFILEIGTEEIPARFLPPALDDLKRITEDMLRQSRIGFGGIKTLGTPRRLAVIVDGIHERQEDSVKEVFGPPKKAAFNADGTLTKAAIGFANSVGVSPDKLVIKEKGKGEYVVAVVEEKGLAVKDVLPEALKKIVLSIHFPKSMRWGDGTLRFVRPIRWILAIYGDKTIKFEIDGIKSGGKTRGHRFLSPKPMKVKDISEYEGLLEKNHVIVDPAKREKLIWNQAEELARSVGGTIMVGLDELLTTVTNLVEYPTAVLGNFDDKYIGLPEELITSVLMGHQKYFPVKGGKDVSFKLLNRFVIVSNTLLEHSDTVRVGAERVVRARLEDARFYFEEDKKRPLIDRLDALKRVTYQEKLGSLYDKTMRVKAIAENLSEHLAGRLSPEEMPLVSRAAELSKCDLITGVVREFPELQGIMGMHYYNLGVEDGNWTWEDKKRVGLALRDQYRYETLGEYVNWSGISAILALADRIDNIASFFSIGLIPTGSEDPFALRRQAIGVISILIDKEYAITLKELVGAAVKGISDSAKVEDDVLKFFEQRVEPLIESSGKYPFDVIQSMKPFFTSLSLKEVFERLNAIKDFQSQPSYNEFLTAIKRVQNIVPHDRVHTPIDEVLFRTDSESQFFSVYKKVSVEIKDALSKRNTITAINSAACLSSPINAFFNETLVMDTDEAIRNNRLSLLQETSSVVWRIADFSKLRETE